MPTKNFSRRCEICDYECNNASNWSKHIRTAKHKKNVEIEVEERIRVKVMVEMAKYREGLINADPTASQSSCNITNNTTNNTINFDASNNVIINVFTPNPDAINLKDLIVPVLKELVKQEIVPVSAIQKAVMDCGDKKPILYHNNSLYVKQNGWLKDNDAEVELEQYCKETQHNLLEQLGDMDFEGDMDMEAKATLLVYEDFNKDAVLYKMKSKLNNKLIK